MAEPSMVPVSTRGSEVMLPHFSPQGGNISSHEPIKAVQAKGEAQLSLDNSKDNRSMEEKVQSANKTMQSLSLNVHFELDQAVVGNVRIIMKDSSGTVVREIPNKKAGELLAKTKQYQDGQLDRGDLSGLLIERKA
jgi:uncharacterized FlaG/YvyC family protein